MSNALFIRLHDRYGNPEFINIQHIQKFWACEGGCQVLIDGSESGDFYREKPSDVLGKILEAKGEFQ